MAADSMPIQRCAVGLPAMQTCRKTADILRFIDFPAGVRMMRGTPPAQG